MSQPSLTLSTELSSWLTELYTQATAQRLVAFKQWCFNSLQSLLPFDSALWATRSDLHQMRNEHWVNDTCLFRQPDAFMSNYAKIAAASKALDLLNQHLGKHPGQFFAIWDCCPKAQWQQTEFYLQHCRLYGVENAISAITLPTDNSAVSHVFSFYRADPNHEFSAEEILLANFVLTNLVEAFRINVLSSFSQTHAKNKSCRAVLDRYGEMLEAEDDFYELMKQHKLLQQTRVDIPRLVDVTTSDSFEYHGLSLDIIFTDGLLYVEARERSLLSDLTDREYQIMELLIKGYGAKEIANILTSAYPEHPIKANTVNTHLGNIYKKLSVKHKTEATAYFLNHTSRS